MFSGKRVVITGGSSGIGKRLARDFLAAGARVAIVSHRADALEACRAELAAVSPHLTAHVCDVSSLDDIRRLGEAYETNFGAPDILVNNAGYAVYTTIEETPIDEVRRLLDVNMSAAFLVTRQFLPSMIRAGTGQIVMMASIAGRVPLTPCGPYSAAKHGMVAAAEVLRAELEDFGIGVHVVCPGRVVETEFFRHESFQTRTPRPETRWTVSLDAVSKATLDAVRSRRFLTYVPRTLRPLVWFSHAMPFISRPILHRLMRSRVRAVYAAKRAEGVDHVSRG